MIADLNILQFGSHFFAKLICRERAIKGLHDGTLYILTGNRCEWNDVVLKVQESIKQSRVRALWHLPYSIEALTDLTSLESDERLLEYMENTEPSYNMIMPLYTPDRSYKCYFLGRLSDVEHLEAAFGFLTVDAQKVCDECSFAAFVTSIDTAPENAKQLWMRLIDYNSRNMLPSGRQISFRGKYNTTVGEYTFLGKGFEKMISVPKIEYADLIDSLNKFPDTVEAISKSTNNSTSNVQMEYVKICQGLSAVDKNELILELSKRIKDKRILAEAIDAVINKAKTSRLKIQLIGKASGGKIDGRRVHGDWSTYLVDENGNKQWLDFEPAAHVIYIMNLINRINNPEKPSVVDVCKQEEAFMSIYNAIYDGDGKEQYIRLVTDERYGTKRLTECYKIIANCVNLQCSFFNESPSPYITTLDKPLTIDPKSIEISEKFKALSSIKKLFFEKLRFSEQKKRILALRTEL